MTSEICLLNEKENCRQLAISFLHCVNEEGDLHIPDEWIEKILKKAQIISYFVGSKLVGWLVLYCNDQENKSAYCAGFHILKPYRYRGGGKVLLQQAIRLCRQTGMEKLTLFCKTDNKPALRLYQQFGFQEVSRCKKEQYNNEEHAFLVLTLP